MSRTQPAFFGRQDQQLFGVYHHARGGNRQSSHAVVICSPIGQEYIRTHWCLRLVAGQLARNGIDVLRFDYSGIGDSANQIRDIQSLATWKNDIQSAIDFLSKSCGAPAVMLLGLRFGANLAANVAERDSRVHSLALWEPVSSGHQYIEDQRNLHAEMLDLRNQPMRSQDDEFGREILGSFYSKSLLDEIQQSLVDWPNIEVPHVRFDLPSSFYHFGQSAENRWCKTERVDDEDSWSELRQLETAWLRPKTTRLVVNQIKDVFRRLERFGILDETAAPVGFGS